jgi:hypothetical protein
MVFGFGIIRTFIALLATLFIFPGLGHLVLGKYKKGFAIMGVTLLSIFIAAMIFMSQVNLSSIPPGNFDQMYKYLAVLLENNPTTMMAIEIIRALLLSYCVVDIAFIFYREYIQNR